MLGNVSPYFFWNARLSSLASLTVTPSTVPPARFRRRCARSISGDSSLHGSHHDAQKLRITGLPLKSAGEAVPDPSLGSVRDGATGRSPRLTASSSVSDPPAPTTP